MKMFKPLTIIATLILFSISGMAFCQKHSPSSTAEQGQTVQLTVNFPDGTSLPIDNIPWIPQMNVRFAMLNAENKETRFSFETRYYFPYGEFVTAINYVVPSINSFWQLSVNGKPSKFGINTTLLKPGDRVTWQIVTIPQKPTTLKKEEQETSLRTMCIPFSVPEVPGTLIDCDTWKVIGQCWGGWPCPDK